MVPIRGNAKIGDLRLYKLEFGEGLAPAAWTQIGPDHYNGVDNNLLENWDTSGPQGRRVPAAS